MKVEVLLFASYRDRAGVDSLALEVEDGATAGAVVDRVRENLGGGEALPPRVAIAVNERHASPGTILHDGDIVALIPPVSGG